MTTITNAENLRQYKKITNTENIRQYKRILNLQQILVFDSSNNLVREGWFPNFKRKIYLPLKNMFK